LPMPQVLFLNKYKIVAQTQFRAVSSKAISWHQNLPNSSLQAIIFHYICLRMDLIQTTLINNILKIDYKTPSMFCSLFAWADLEQNPSIINMIF
jgi:hypothetical protein